MRVCVCVCVCVCIVISLSTHRGLFEKDKLVFSFMLCGEIMRQAGHISDTEWNFFLRGPPGTEKVYNYSHSYTHTCTYIMYSIYNVHVHVRILCTVYTCTCTYICAAQSQERPEKPDVPWLTTGLWNICCDMEDMLPAFKGITSDIVTTPIHCKAGRVEVRERNSQHVYMYIHVHVYLKTFTTKNLVNPIKQLFEKKFDECMHAANMH